jgi:hypothetical protein
MIEFIALALLTGGDATQINEQDFGCATARKLSSKGFGTFAAASIHHAGEKWDPMGWRGCEGRK